jgi:hypothetical protein
MTDAYTRAFSIAFYAANLLPCEAVSTFGLSREPTPPCEATSTFGLSRKPTPPVKLYRALFMAAAPEPRTPRGHPIGFIVARPCVQTTAVTAAAQGTSVRAMGVQMDVGGGLFRVFCFAIYITSSSNRP